MVKGIIGRKVGMTQIFSEDRKWVPVTVIQAGPCTVVRAKTNEKEGYNAVQLAFEEQKPQRLNKADLGQFVKRELKPHRVLREVEVDNAAEVEVGSPVTVEMFGDVQWVDVQGTSKGRGFTGVMRRWNFRGQPATHGCTTHRAPGSIGQCATPSRVFKNKKMPGQYGNVTRTVLKLAVVGVDAEKNLLLVKGAIPGGKRGLVLIRRSKKEMK